MYLDWTSDEVTQTVCKWFLQSETFFQLLMQDNHFLPQEIKDELPKMRNLPEYELPLKVAEEIIGIVFEVGKFFGVWNIFLMLLQYRTHQDLGYYLPRDVIECIKFILQNYIQEGHNDQHGTAPLLSKLKGIDISTNEDLWDLVSKKQFLHTYDSRIINLIQSNPDIIITPEFYFDQWKKKYAELENENSFYEVLNKAVLLGIITKINSSEAYRPLLIYQKL